VQLIGRDALDVEVVVSQVVAPSCTESATYRGPC
jgi:hypothetical protein